MLLEVHPYLSYVKSRFLLVGIDLAIWFPRFFYIGRKGQYNTVFLAK
jgi:hypothetical protein